MGLIPTLDDSPYDVVCVYEGQEASREGLGVGYEGGQLSHAHLVRQETCSKKNIHECTGVKCLVGRA